MIPMETIRSSGSMDLNYQIMIQTGIRVILCSMLKSQLHFKFVLPKTKAI